MLRDEKRINITGQQQGRIDEGDSAGLIVRDKPPVATLWVSLVRAFRDENAYKKWLQLKRISKSIGSEPDKIVYYHVFPFLLFFLLSASKIGGQEASCPASISVFVLLCAVVGCLTYTCRGPQNDGLAVITDSPFFAQRGRPASQNYWRGGGRPPLSLLATGKRSERIKLCLCFNSGLRPQEADQENNRRQILNEWPSSSVEMFLIPRCFPTREAVLV